MYIGAGNIEIRGSNGLWRRQAICVAARQCLVLVPSGGALSMSSGNIRGCKQVSNIVSRRWETYCTRVSTIASFPSHSPALHPLLFASPQPSCVLRIDQSTDHGGDRVENGGR
jgi:hypothetical protein